MADIIDILSPRAQYTARGIFFKSRPLNHNSGGVSFAYSYVEPRSSAFARLFANVISEDGSIAIHTNKRLDIVPGESCIRTQNGQLYIVNQVMEDYNKASQQALRLFKRPVGIELLIRMTPINNPLSDEP